MKPAAFDTETVPTRPGLKAPPMACLTWDEGHGPGILHGKDPSAKERFAAWLHDPSVLLVGHFVAYDMTVGAAAWPDLLPDIFAAYEANRVTDTMLREKLYDIAADRFRGFADSRGVWRKNDYNLDAVARRRVGTPLKKDGWRLRYGDFVDVPLEKWVEKAAAIREDAIVRVAAGDTDKDLKAIAEGPPDDVVRYPLEDARATLAVYLAQEQARGSSEADPFVDEFRQARASFWLTLMTAYGLRTHPEGVELLRVQTEREITKLEADLIRAGLVRPDGSRDVKAAKARMLEVMGWKQHATKEGRTSIYTYEKLRPDARPLRKSDANDVSLDRDACKESEDPILIDYGDRVQLKAVLDKDVPMLMAGTLAPVHTRIDIVASGRTSSSAPNIQNLRRLPGIREAFVPRPGYVYMQADYPGLELRTLAQACFDLFGYSSLGDMLNAGKDPHLAFAANMLSISYDEAKANKKRKDVDDARQVGKVNNFGLPGGLGTEPKKDGSEPTLITFARKTYDVHLTVDQCREYKRTWLETFPEMREFFAYVRRLVDNPAKLATIRQLRSNRLRGGCRYTAGCNTLFQGLGADATKDAGFDIAKACYVVRQSPLFGSRLVAFVHDEFIGETRDTPAAHDAAFELARLMKEGANRWLPNVPFTEIEPVLMRVWSKDAEALFDEKKRLVPWEPALGGLIKMGEAIKSAADRAPTLRLTA